MASGGSRPAAGRLEALGLGKALRPDRPGGAPLLTLDRTHTLYEPLAGLFRAERSLVRR